jgi:hypothetical protein
MIHHLIAALKTAYEIFNEAMAMRAAMSRRHNLGGE